jgi:diguanylate cyclase (GGDEF)-like protein
LLYRYRFGGLEQHWVTSEHPEIDYPPLPPGRYTFQASVVDPDERQESNIAELPIEIVPAWWQRTPAIIGALSLFLLTLAAIWQLRTRHLRLRAEELSRLVALRTRELETDKQALEEARMALWHQATHDALTGLPNRSHVLSILDQAIAEAQSTHRPLAVALLDLDHFKRINDQFGHVAGDQVLIEAAVRLCQVLPSGSTLGRYGGEELLVVTPGAALDDPAPFEVLRHCVERLPFDGDGAPIHMTCSIGVAWVGADRNSVLEVIRRADAALYLAKSAGRNRVVVANAGDELRSAADRH